MIYMQLSDNVNVCHKSVLKMLVKSEMASKIVFSHQRGWKRIRYEAKYMYYSYSYHERMQ